MSYIIQTAQLSKQIGSQRIIESIDLHVQQGEIYGLLGTNSAGKTALLRLLTGQLLPSSGEIAIFQQALKGHTPAILKRIGTLIAQPAFYDQLSVNQNLELHMRYMGYYQRKAVNEILHVLKLEAQQNTLVRELDVANKQRLAIARAIITRPELLLLDEPSQGLDPLATRDIHQLLLQLNQEYDTTILFTSNSLSEIELLADTIGILKQGRLLQELPIKQIQQSASSYIEISTEQASRACMILEQQLQISSFRLHNDQQIRVYQQQHHATQILKTLVMQDVPIEVFRQHRQTLEDHVFDLLNKN